MQDIKILAEKLVPHRADAQGERIVRLQYIQAPGGVVVVEFWGHWDSGEVALSRVSHRNLRAGETF